VINASIFDVLAVDITNQRRIENLKFLSRVEVDFVFKKHNVLPDGRATNQDANDTTKTQKLRVPVEAIVIRSLQPGRSALIIKLGQKVTNTFP
jgi:hypothetical protein